MEIVTNPYGTSGWYGSGSGGVVEVSDNCALTYPNTPSSKHTNNCNSASYNYNTVLNGHYWLIQGAYGSDKKCH